MRSDYFKEVFGRLFKYLFAFFANFKKTDNYSLFIWLVGSVLSFVIASHSI